METEEPLYRFMSLVSEDGPDDLSDPATPARGLVDALKAASVFHEVYETVYSSEEAAADPELAHFYPRGPSSGPPTLALYEFATTKPEFPHARKVAEALFP